MKSISVKISGVVQGVFFRKYTREKAIQLGLTGFVQNEADGSVFAQVTGHESSIEPFIEWCYLGSPKSRVDKVEVSELPLQKFDGFEIREV